MVRYALIGRTVPPTVRMRRRYVSKSVPPPIRLLVISEGVAVADQSPIDSPLEFLRRERVAGHGHVLPRVDGTLIRCGRPGRCAHCRRVQEIQAAVFRWQALQPRLSFVLTAQQPALRGPAACQAVDAAADVNASTPLQHGHGEEVEV